MVFLGIQYSSKGGEVGGGIFDRQGNIIPESSPLPAVDPEIALNSGKHWEHDDDLVIRMQVLYFINEI